MEKSQLYDLIIDLPTHPSPPSRPPLFASFPIPNPPRGSPTHGIRQIRPTFSDTRFWFDIQESLPSQPLEDGDSASVARDWQEALWVYMLRFWLAIQPNRTIRMTGDDELRTDVGNPTTSDDNDDDEPPQSPTSAVMLLDRDPSSSASNNRVVQTLTTVQRHIAFFDERASSFIGPTLSSHSPSAPPSNPETNSSPVQLLPADIGSFGLNPFSPRDVEFCRSFVAASIRRRLQLEALDAESALLEVEVNKPWREMLYWLIGWS